MPDVSETPTAEAEVWWVRHATISPAWITAGTTQAERERATRFDRPQWRTRFLAGRALARHVVAATLSITPADLVITRTCRFCGGETHGKPTVGTTTPLWWSLSRSDDLCALALSRQVDVGLDLVSLSATVATLSPREWAEAEAVLKLSGRGLEDDPRDVKLEPGVALAPGHPPAIVTEVPLPDTIAMLASNGALAVTVREVTGASGVLF